MLEVFDLYIKRPVLSDDVGVFALAMELGDRLYTRSVQVHDEITPLMVEVAMRVFDAYLGFIVVFGVQKA